MSHLSWWFFDTHKMCHPRHITLKQFPLSYRGFIENWHKCLEIPHVQLEQQKTSRLHSWSIISHILFADMFKLWLLIFFFKQGNTNPTTTTTTTKKNSPELVPPWARQYDSKLLLNDVVTWCRCPRRYPGNTKNRDESRVENYGPQIWRFKQIGLQNLIVGNIRYI